MNGYHLFNPSYQNKPASAMLMIINKLKNSESQDACLHQAYNYITNRYEGGRVKTFTHLWEITSKNIDELWSRQGFLHCTNQNYLLATLLVHSGHFSPDDIRAKWTTIWLFSPHQYLLISLKEHGPIAIDPWGRHYGIAFGNYATRFNTTIFKKFAE